MIQRPVQAKEGRRRDREDGLHAGSDVSIGRGRNHPLMPVDLALEKRLAMVQAVAGTEMVDLEAASGRVLARTLVAQRPLPHFAYSAMDGYALSVADLPDAMLAELKVIGRIAAGDRGVDYETLTDSAAIRILTGAPVPNGVDAVIAQEEVKRENDVITVFRTPRPGENIRPCGEDAQVGDVLVEGHRLLGPREIGVAASMGHLQVEVFRKVRVAIFSTGSELRQPGEALADGQIYNSNRFVLRGLLNRPWINLVDLGACPDDRAALQAYLSNATAQADIVVTTGGVSVGDEDHMPDIVRQCGGTLGVLNVAIKPGKPLTLGRLDKALYVGLPGNPAAASSPLLRGVTWKLDHETSAPPESPLPA